MNQNRNFDDENKAAEAGQKGGRAAQDSGNAHELTNEERSEGGKNSSGQFKEGSERARKAGRTGGSR